MNNSKLYTENNSEQMEGAEKFFNLFGERIVNEFGNKKISLIDIGSGCGKVLNEVIIKKSGLSISNAIGVDKSNEMIKLSNQNYGNSSTSFCFMDAEEDIPNTLKNKKIDMVTSIYCHHWVKDLEKGFKIIYNLLDDEGLFCCVFLSWHIIIDIWNALEEKYAPYTKDWKKYFTHLFFRDNADEIMKKYLTSAGFKILEFYDGRNETFDYGKIQNFSSKLIIVPIVQLINLFLFNQ